MQYRIKLVALEQTLRELARNGETVVDTENRGKYVIVTTVDTPTVETR